MLCADGAVESHFEVAVGHHAAEFFYAFSVECELVIVKVNVPDAEAVF